MSLAGWVTLWFLRPLIMDNESPRFATWLHKPTNAHYIVDAELSLAVGPIPDHEALRRLREANEWVPDGCDLGPWTWGFEHMSPLKQPFPDQEWEPMEPSWLSPSVSSYQWSDKETQQVSCSGWADANPRVDWNAETSGHLAAEQLADAMRLGELSRPLQECSVGVTTKTWNTHPRGCVVLAVSTAPGERFLVIDVPPTEAT